MSRSRKSQTEFDDGTELPPPTIRHWVAARKAQVVNAVQSGRLSLDEALRRYRLSIEEFSSWKTALYRQGVQGLRISARHVRDLNRRIRPRARSKGGERHA
jgi:hypothetical protein